MLVQTLQLDFNLPERFNLKYKTEDGYEQPVLIHRAIFGSVERFIAILLEHTSGKLPFWLSPRQICIVPVANKYNDYANIIKEKFIDKFSETIVDDSTETMNKKIRNAEKLKFNYIFVVGEKEEESNLINIRARKNVLGTKTIEETLELCENDFNERLIFQIKK